MLFWYKICISVSLILFCKAQHEDRRNKNVAVERIIRKVFNLTSQSLGNANSVEKKDLMKIIERNLAKSAEPLGSKADKYVKIIMHGLQIMVNNQSVTKTISTSNRQVLRNGIINYNERLLSRDAAQELAHKILKLAEKYFDESGDNKKKIIENIKERILETAKLRHDLIHVKHEKIIKYTDLITRGMELMMKKLSGNKSKSNKRRMVMEFVNTRNSRDGNKSIKGDNTTLDNLLHESEEENFSKLDHVSTVPPTGQPVLTTAFSCDAIFRQTCSEIKSLNEFVCSDNKQILPLSNTCNGVVDCPDESDERDCINQGMKRMQKATNLISRIELFLIRDCFLSDNNALLIKQNAILNDVLQRQISFLNKYTKMDRSVLELSDAFAFKKTLNEVALVINSLAIALDSSLCSRLKNKKKVEEETRKFNRLEMDDLDDLTEQPISKVSLRSCSCTGSFCSNLTCPEACKRICWHKKNLDKWICQAVDEETSVPLDLVCDGKLDCFDETDEIGCNAGSQQGKFEANELFDSVLKLITSKTAVKEYASVKSKLISLGNMIIKLQKAVMVPKIDEVYIKNTRDESYASLVSIYEDLVNKAFNIEDLEDAHLFLLNVNEKLMSALKRSHTGNDRIISAEGCYCRKSKCASIACTPSCKRACAISPKLNRYWCKGIVHSNISVPLDGICNGTPNCPLEDDESHCSIDVCRKHHLLLLRHNIRDVGEKQKGTSLGEALLSWKTKVTSTLKIAENNYRPTPAGLRELVSTMLRDLVMTYAALDEGRRTVRANTGHVVKEFYDIAQRLIENLKSCAK